MLNEQHHCQTNYTTERWKLLTEIIKEISSNDYQIDALEFKKRFINQEDFEFVSSRLSKLGLLYFQDLGAGYQSLHLSREMAKDRYTTDKVEGLESEVELLFSPPKCLVGIPIKDMHSLSTVCDKDYWFEELPVPDFNLNTRFVFNDDNEAVLFVGEQY